MLNSILVFSHLRWNFVYQRPQHLLARFAQHYRVWFVEEPVYASGTTEMRVTRDASGVYVCEPHTQSRASGFHDDQIEVMQKLVAQLVEQEELGNYAVWFYTPMALPLIRSLSPRVIAYDCMDELSAFLNAPKQLIQRERALLQQADVVFTGGPSLYRAKADRHPSVYCYASSVDRTHFANAARAGEDHPDQRGIPAPRLGFFGVIDERLDLPLLAALADARPEWHIAMVGPVVKISSASLPRRANIHYLGQRAYEELPQFLRGWDVCLLPFALNASTRYISPTKTLEYMAAGKPIVSTPITDVVDLHGDIVRIAATASEFEAACARALAETPTEREARVLSMRERLRTTSWDATATAMRASLEEAAMGGGRSRREGAQPPWRQRLRVATAVSATRQS
jgi:UDP-galactopyranose mutase